MSENRYIVYGFTPTTVEQKYMEEKTKMLELITSNIWIVIGVWLILGTYLLWYFFKPKTIQPLTLDALAITWELHKKQTGCNAPHVDSILVNNNNVIGFKCESGYTYKQQRLVTQNLHANPKTSIMSTSHHQITNLSETQNTLDQMGLEYVHVRKI